MGEFLKVERRGKIAILTMIKPESMNAIGTHDDCQDIVQTLRQLGEDRGVSAIILTGSGKAFSAGGNLKSMQERKGIGVLDQPDATRSNYRKGVQAVIRALMDCEIPMIAAANGHAIGLGCEVISPELLAMEIEEAGKKVEKLTIQQVGGSKKAIEKGIEIAQALLNLGRTSLGYMEGRQGNIFPCHAIDHTSRTAIHFYNSIRREDHTIVSPFDIMTLCNGIGFFHERDGCSILFQLSVNSVVIRLHV